MPTIERTPPESVARCNTLGAQHATPGQCAQHSPQRGAQRSGAADVKTLAVQALARTEGRNGARNTERNTDVGGRCIDNEGAQHPAEHGRTAPDSAGWRDYSRNVPQSASMTAARPASMPRPSPWRRTVWRGGARSIPSRLQAMALAFNVARRGPIRPCWRGTATHGSTAHVSRR